MKDDIELYNEFEEILEKTIDKFEKKHDCEINLRLIEVKPAEED